MFRIFARHCAVCSGNVYRRFSFIEKVGLFLPIPYGLHATHQCVDCGRVFRSYRSLADAIMLILFGVGTVMLGRWWWLSLVLLAAWALISSARTYQTKTGLLGPGYTLIAGMILGILWSCVFVVAEHPIFRKIQESTDYDIFLMCCYSGLGFGLMVLVLDRFTTFKMAEIEPPSHLPPAHGKGDRHKS